MKSSEVKAIIDEQIAEARELLGELDPERQNQLDEALEAAEAVGATFASLMSIITISKMSGLADTMDVCADRLEKLMKRMEGTADITRKAADGIRKANANNNQDIN